MSIDIHRTTWQADAARIKSVRVPVFVEEQGVSFDEDFDGSDEPCVHALAVSDGRAVGTGRVDLQGRIGRIAVLTPYRGQGIGASLVRYLVAVSRQQGLPGVYLHAQCAAEAFYAGLGFYSTGEVFLDANIEHVRMNFDFVQSHGNGTS